MPKKNSIHYDEASPCATCSDRDNCEFCCILCLWLNDDPDCDNCDLMDI